MLPSDSSGSKLGLKDVLFFRTNENTRSSAALECGMVKTSSATQVSKENWGLPSTLFLAASCAQIMSIE